MVVENKNRALNNKPIGVLELMNKVQVIVGMITLATKAFVN